LLNCQAIRCLAFDATSTSKTLLQYASFIISSFTKTTECGSNLEGKGVKNGALTSRERDSLFLFLKL